jgi:hypothetical protein
MITIPIIKYHIYIYVYTNYIKIISINIIIFINIYSPEVARG